MSGVVLDQDVDLLPEPPGTGTLLLRAAWGLRPGRSDRPQLPARRVMAVEVRQDLGRLAAYDRLCGFPLRDAVPPTWLHVLTFPLQTHLMTAADFPFPAVGMVHVANTMRWRRPVGLEEALTLSTWAQDLRPHRSGATVDLLGAVRVGEEVVWEGRSTYLARGVSVPGDPVAEAEAPEDETAPPPPSARWRLPADLGRRYAGVAGDINPIHLHPLAARVLGFPRAIAHGMWTHARALAALERHVGEAGEVSVRFGKPVLLPSTVAFGQAAAGDRHRFAVTSTDGSRTHLTGELSSSPAGPGTMPQRGRDRAHPDFTSEPGAV